MVAAMAATGLSLRAQPAGSSQAAGAQPGRPAGGRAAATPAATPPATPSATPAAAPATGPNPSCTLIVPARPLTARGLATPYQLTATNPAAGPCHEANPGQSAFVQAGVFDPATGRISVYNPLVTDAGTTPAAAPVRPALPPGAIVAIWFGFNGDVLTLQDTTNGSTLVASGCVGGLVTGQAVSPFGQVSYCNARPFFQAANSAVRRHLLIVPSPGRAADGLPCLTLRNFALIDQDQSDNVTAQYLVTSNGRTAIDTAATRQRLPVSTVLSNGSDNGLLTFFMDPALGCTPWLAPSLADGGAPVSALPLNEIQAAVYAGRGNSGPAALVPLNDPMTTVNGALSSRKTDAYRAGMDQSRLPGGQTPARYCVLMEQLQSTRLQQDVNLLIGQPSPDPAAASNLFTFLASRLQQSFVNLGCQHYGLTNDVTVTANGTGVAVAACFRYQARPLTPGRGNPQAGRAACPKPAPA
jgi:hypothetical protein